MDNWTVQKLLKRIAECLAREGIDSPRLSAELLLSHVLGMKRVELYTHMEERIGQQQADQLQELTEQAGRHEPIAYLTGQTEFYSLELNVTPDCMIPRPETELLVERALEFLQARGGLQLVCDLCTGCGCIAVVIAKHCPAVRIIATDISADALKVAAQNVQKHLLHGQVELLCGDLFEPVTTRLSGDRFDLIVCNPPYVSAIEYEALAKNVRDYEPRLALFAGADGLDICRRVIQEAGGLLKPGGALILEIGFSQGPAVKRLLRQTGTFTAIRIDKDFQDHDRIAIASKMSL